MPLNCERKSPGNHRDTCFGYWLGNDRFADLAEGREFDAVAYDRAIREPFCSLARFLAAHAIEFVGRGFDLPTFALVFDELAQIVTTDQDGAFTIHHGQAFRYPIADGAR